MRNPGTSRGVLKRIRDNLWLATRCADFATIRAMKSGRAPGSMGELRLRGVPPMLFRSQTSDVPVAWELFHDREYEPRKPLGRWRSVVDCGANIGLFAAWLMSQGHPIERYVGVEPDDGSYAVLEQQVERLGIDACLLKAAVWESSGSVSFDETGPSYSHRVAASGRSSVRAMTVPEILDAAGLQRCDLLKMDVEGGERVVLPGIAAWGDRVGALVAELHGGLDFEWFRAQVEPAGFSAHRPGELFGQVGAIRRA